MKYRKWGFYVKKDWLKLIPRVYIPFNIFCSEGSFSSNVLEFNTHSKYLEIFNSWIIIFRITYSLLMILAIEAIVLRSYHYHANLITNAVTTSIVSLTIDQLLDRLNQHQTWTSAKESLPLGPLISISLANLFTSNSSLLSVAIICADWNSPSSTLSTKNLAPSIRFWEYIFFHYSSSWHYLSNGY